jgi:hypothetical protein
MCVNRPGAILAGAHPILPMVVISKAAAWPSDYWRADTLHGFNHVVSYTVGIGYRRIFAYPYTFVYTPSQMFCEMPIYIGVDPSYVFIEADPDNCFVSSHILFILLSITSFSVVGEGKWVLAHVYKHRIPIVGLSS